MFIRKVKIHNFKCYRDFEITLEEGLNIVVGDNEAGKSTILVQRIINNCYIKPMPLPLH